MLGLLITLIFLCLIFAVAWWIISIIPLPAPFNLVVQVLFGLIVLIVLIGMLTGGIGTLPVLRFNNP